MSLFFEEVQRFKGSKRQRNIGAEGKGISS